MQASTFVSILVRVKYWTAKSWNWLIDFNNNFIRNLLHFKKSQLAQCWRELYNSHGMEFPRIENFIHILVFFFLSITTEASHKLSWIFFKATYSLRLTKFSFRDIFKGFPQQLIPRTFHKTCREITSTPLTSWRRKKFIKFLSPFQNRWIGKFEREKCFTVNDHQSPIYVIS